MKPLHLSRVRNVARSLAVRALPFAAAGACATQGGVEAEPLERASDASVEITAPSDAAPIEDPRPEAGSCSSAGLCTVRVPIDTRIHITSISGSGPNDVWAVGTDRTILHYDGATWEKALGNEVDASPYTLRSVWVGGPDDVWVADGTTLRHSTGWKGPSDTEWSFASLKDDGFPTTIRGMGGTVAIARQLDTYWGDSALVVSGGWADGGILNANHVSNLIPGANSYYMMPSGLWSLTMVRPDEVWATAVGAKNVGGSAAPPGAHVLRAYVRHHDGGSGSAQTAPWQFEDYESSTSKNLYGVWVDERAVWLVGEGGTIRLLKRENLSKRIFEIVASPVVSTLHGIHGFSPDDIWAVGDDATVVHWDGDSWTRLVTPFDEAVTKPRLFAVWGSGPDDVWIGGNAVLLHFRGKGR